MATAFPPNLADAARIEHQVAFASAVADHGIKPLVLPYALLGPMVLPPLWLAIPHTKRPWVYRTRWLVVGLIVALDVDLIYSVSSYNVACAYGAGLIGCWGILHTLDLLIWTRPQFDAARIIKAAKPDKAFITTAAETRTDNGTLREDGVRQRKLDKANGHVCQSSPDHALSNNEQTGYVWQPFPENGSFLQRLNWSTDFVTNYRCIGTSASPKGRNPFSLTQCLHQHIQAGTVVSPPSPGLRSLHAFGMETRFLSVPCPSFLGADFDGALPCPSLSGLVSGPWPFST